MTLQTIQELRELEEKATEGEWGYERRLDYFSIYPLSGLISVKDNNEGNDADYQLIVSLRNNAKELLDVAEECLRLREEVRELKKTVTDLAWSSGARNV